MKTSERYRTSFWDSITLSTLSMYKGFDETGTRTPFVALKGGSFDRLPRERQSESLLFILSGDKERLSESYSTDAVTGR